MAYIKPVVALIEWFGPYSLEGAKEATSEFDYEDGLYIVIGKLNGQRASQIQYVGLASNLRSRLSGNHHAIHKVTKDQKLWLGEIISPRTPGRKIKVTDRMLDLAEWAHAYFLQLPLNLKKKSKPPDRPIVVYNKWWRTDFETPHKRRPHVQWPDIIDYNGSEYAAKLVWFGGSQMVQDVSFFTPKALSAAD